jgi:hypothetical protein
MSIMDHDPKYAKLRMWREERERVIMQERLRKCHRMIPRKVWTGNLYNYKPITALVRE